MVHTARRSINLATEIPLDTRDKMHQWIRANLTIRDKILIDKKYYNAQFTPGMQLHIQYLDGEKLLEELQLDNLRKLEGDYLLISSLQFNRYFTEPKRTVQSRIIIDNLFKHLELVKKIEPEHGTYGFHNPGLYLFKINPTQLKISLLVQK